MFFLPNWNKVNNNNNNNKFNLFFRMLNINFEKMSFVTFVTLTVFEIFIKLKSIFDPLKTIYWKIFIYLLLAFANWWMTWHIPPLILFSSIHSMSISVNNSDFTFVIFKLLTMLIQELKEILQDLNENSSEIFENINQK